MKYRTIFRPEARAELRKLPKSVTMNIFRKLEQLERNPLGLGTTAMVGMPEVRRLRVGDYRIIYTLDNGELVIWVLNVGHRSRIYE
ncbi:type II toxin-antitoxin system RelE family toxin [Marinactinospora rubrisoli]|uniref:Type II toxin-antitoxin system RelE/ParE family toxin n=1 Tax=Marinactinospora rubrisoli TaxID=2715399 RepID=A0ABW2KC41_9ACTN